MAVGQGYKATIVSGGPGDTYTANIEGVGNATAKCIQIDAGETIPPGTGILVVQTSVGYKFQVPVWVAAP